MIVRDTLRSGLPAFLLILSACREPPPSHLVVWAWERPEDLRFLDDRTEVAVQTGFVEITGDTVRARGRRAPLRIARVPAVAVVHVQIDHARKLSWTPSLRRAVGAAVLHYARAIPVRTVQVDFEVRASERRALLDVLGDVRRGLPAQVRLSMTALASWCANERWLEQAPVDEIVPMLFRMGKDGDHITKRLAQGRDFDDPACRTALAISTDSPVRRAPPGRRIYLFNPRSWAASDLRRARRIVEAWR